MSLQKITISAAIITRNEAHCIKNCLDSLLDKFDEIIVIDTGSTDQTVEIVKRYENNVKIYFMSWDDNFSAPRNFALEKASCEYIFFIDSDEKLNSTRHEIYYWFKKLDKVAANSCFALCPQIIELNGNISYTVKRGFRNNGVLKYHGFIHEELRSRNSLPVSDLKTDISITHSGYTSEEIINKNKTSRNRRLNERNILAEPDHLRWHYFLFRDAFESFPPEKTFNDLKKIILKKKNNGLTFFNLKNDEYTFAIIDLMARAKIILMDNDKDFYKLINMLNMLMPDNSNAFFYTLIYEFLKHKRKVKETLINIATYKIKHKAVKEFDMIRSDGLHIDTMLALYLYENGEITKAYRLLTSVKENGFTTNLIEDYLSKMNSFIREYAWLKK